MKNFNKNINFTLQQLFYIRIHLGHKYNLINQQMVSYLAGVRHQVTIFDLEKIIISLRILHNVLAQIFSRRGTIFLLGTNEYLPLTELMTYFMSKYSKDNILKRYCIILGYISRKWVGGVFSNWKVVRVFIDYMNKSSRKKSKRYQRYLTNLEGINSKTKFNPIPDFIFAFNFDKEAVNEISRLQIPIMGILDSDSNPRDYLYKLPANDDSIESLQFFCNFLEEAMLAGRIIEYNNFINYSLYNIKTYLNKPVLTQNLVQNKLKKSKTQ